MSSQNVSNAEEFLGDLKGKLKDPYTSSVRVSPLGISFLYRLAGTDENQLPPDDDEAEYFLKPKELKDLIRQAEICLRRRSFHIVR